MLRPTLRIVSLIPSGTEIVAGLVSDPAELVGVTHECDSPEWVRDLPKVIHPSDTSLHELPPCEIDHRVSQAIGSGESLYTIDAELLQRLQPDIIVTQRLCDVCAAMPEQVEAAIATLEKKPKVVELSPHTLGDVLDDVIRVAEAMGRKPSGECWRDELMELVELCQNCDESLEWMPAGLVNIEEPPRVLALEWSDPLWIGGHWVPEMIERAGGVSLAGAAGEPSTRISWDEVEKLAPDWVLLIGCGHDVAKNLAQKETLEASPAWSRLPAVRNGRVFALDANGYFSRSGPRLVNGILLLRQLFAGQAPVPELCQPFYPERLARSQGTRWFAPQTLTAAK